jgi:hypothetical protein
MTRPSFLAGHNVTAQDYLDAFPLVGASTVDQVVTNSITLVDAVGLSVPLAAATYYHFRAVLWYAVNAANDLKVGRDGTATYTSIIWTMQSIPNGGTNGQWFSLANTSTASTWIAEGQGVAQPALAIVEGDCLVNAGGTLTIQFAENVAGAASTCTLLAMSNLQALKM